MKELNNGAYVRIQKMKKINKYKLKIIKNKIMIIMI